MLELFESYLDDDNSSYFSKFSTFLDKLEFYFDKY